MRQSWRSDLVRGCRSGASSKGLQMNDEKSAFLAVVQCLRTATPAAKCNSTISRHAVNVARWGKEDDLNCCKVPAMFILSCAQERLFPCIFQNTLFANIVLLHQSRVTSRIGNDKLCPCKLRTLFNASGRSTDSRSEKFLKTLRLSSQLCSVLF
jgi:hypothetical protein